MYQSSRQLTCSICNKSLLGFGNHGMRKPNRANLFNFVFLEVFSFNTNPPTQNLSIDTVWKSRQTTAGMVENFAMQIFTVSSLISLKTKQHHVYSLIDLTSFRKFICGEKQLCDKACQKNSLAVLFFKNCHKGN